jgi:WD40 repeat protein
MALLYRGGKTIRLFDISKGHDPIELEPLNSEEDDAFMCLSWSPVGKILAIGGRRGRIYFMDMSDYTRPNLLTVVVHGDGGVHDLSWSADGRRILSCNYDRTFRDHTGTAKVWDVSTPASAREVLCLSNEEGIESAVMSGDGEKAVTITSGDAFGFNMTNWDISDPASPSMISVIRFDTELDFRTRFVFLVANYRDIMVVFNNGCAHQFLLVNPATGKTIAEIPHPADRFIDNDPFKDYSYNPVIPFRFGQYVICSCPGRIVHLDDPYHDIVTLDHGAGRCKTGTLAYAPTSATIAVSYNFNKGLFGSYGFVDIYRAPTLLEFIAQHTR